MFAYCNNSPIILSDESGHIPDPFSPVDIFGCHGRSKPATTKIPENFYTKSEGLINGQALPPYADIPFGFGTYGRNGCGIIAIYNAMQLLGHHEPLAVIDMEIFVQGGYSFGGLLGTKLGSIEPYFSSNGITCVGYSTVASLSQNVYEGAVVIVMVLNNVNNVYEGAHYFTAQYRNGRYETYYMFTYRSDSPSVDALLQPYGDSCFLYGFIVGG